MHGKLITKNATMLYKKWVFVAFLIMQVLTVRENSIKATSRPLLDVFTIHD